MGVLAKGKGIGRRPGGRPIKQKPGPKSGKEGWFDRALTNDKEFVEELLIDSKRLYRKNLAYLEMIRDGEVMDSQYDPKSGTILAKPPSMDVRVKAIAQITSMTLHKVLADKKETMRQSGEEKGVGHEEALKRIEAEREKDRIAEKLRADSAAGVPPALKMIKVG